MRRSPHRRSLMRFAAGFRPAPCAAFARHGDTGMTHVAHSPPSAMADLNLPARKEVKRDAQLTSSVTTCVMHRSPRHPSICTATRSSAPDSCELAGSAPSGVNGLPQFGALSCTSGKAGTGCMPPSAISSTGQGRSLASHAEHATQQLPVENLSSRLRNCLTLRRHLTSGKAWLCLLQFFFNYRRFMRSRCGKRLGQSPRKAMTGEVHPHSPTLLGPGTLQPRQS